MLAKQSIVAALGEQALALPRLLEAALGANDRIKYRLTLLQLARRHADAPESAAVDLRAERLAAQIDTPALDELPSRCRLLGTGRYEVPGLPALLAQLAADLRTMLAPLEVVGAGAPDERLRHLLARADVLLPTLRSQGNELAGLQLDDWSRAQPDRGDSVHLLVMDAHRELNRLQQAIATQIVDGASTYGLGEADPPRVRAFMRGINRTARLKFDHPGLATTATRARDQLVIQNDIGTTDAHVVVIHVCAQKVTVTYTDVHLRRLLFVQALLERFAVDWHDTRVVQDAAMTDGMYHVAVGTFTGRTDEDVDGFLDFLGSRLVFLIDWNRARKQLGLLVGKKEAVRLLEWAARHDVGHMGLLAVGGARAVFDAVDFAARGHGHFGQTLNDMLGEEPAGRFLEFALRTATMERLADRPDSLVHDELRAELLRQLRSSSANVLDLVCEHGGLIAEMASALADALAGLGRADGQETAERLAARCARWESDADRLVNDVREAVRTATETVYLREVVQQADDVADDLEEMAFLVTLLRRAEVSAPFVDDLYALARRLVAGSQELVKALESVRGLTPTATRDDLKDFLEAIHQVGRVEHETDALKRRLDVRLASEAVGPRALYFVAQGAAGLEQAGDHLQDVAMLLRERVLGQLVPG